MRCHIFTGIAPSVSQILRNSANLYKEFQQSAVRSRQTDGRRTAGGQQGKRFPVLLKASHIKGFHMQQNAVQGTKASARVGAYFPSINCSFKFTEHVFC